MIRLKVVVAGVLLAILGQVSPAAADEPPVPTPPSRPNIVMFYIDDVPPHDGSLWSNPALTPNIYDHFVAHGINFNRSIGEDPLCCPARGNMLTGQHTHNNRVI